MHRRALDALVELIEAIREARESGGVPAERIAAAQALQRRAQFLIDFLEAENSMGFHADQEGARVLVQAVDLARQGQLALLGARSATAPES